MLTFLFCTRWPFSLSASHLTLTTTTTHTPHLHYLPHTSLLSSSLHDSLPCTHLLFAHTHTCHLPAHRSLYYTFTHTHTVLFLFLLVPIKEKEKDLTRKTCCHSLPSPSLPFPFTCYLTCLPLPSLFLYLYLLPYFCISISYILDLGQDFDMTRTDRTRFWDTALGRYILILLPVHLPLPL